MREGSGSGSVCCTIGSGSERPKPTDPEPDPQHCPANLKAIEKTLKCCIYLWWSLPAWGLQGDVVYLGRPIATSLYEPKCGGGGSCGVLVNEYSCAHGAQINFGDLTPYLTYDCQVWFWRARWAQQLPPEGQRPLLQTPLSRTAALNGLLVTPKKRRRNWKEVSMLSFIVDTFVPENCRITYVF